VSFAAITLCVAYKRVFIVVYFIIDSVRKLLDTPSYCIPLDLFIFYSYFVSWDNIRMDLKDIGWECVDWVLEPSSFFRIKIEVDGTPVPVLNQVTLHKDVFIP